MKRQRKQPRRLTPPLVLRGEESGERVGILVDESRVTGEAMVSGMVRGLLRIGPGLKVTIQSRCVRKRRIPVVRISAPQGEEEPTTPIL